MTSYQWLSIILSALALVFLAVASFVVIWRRRHSSTPVREGWLTDDMVRQIIERGALTDEQVPEAALDLEQIAREEERFWSETWDEPEHYWE